MSHYANVYELDRDYGGGEEGGWWYDIAIPIKSVKCRTLRGAIRKLKKLAIEYPDNAEFPLHSVVYNGGHYSYQIETEPAKAKPESQPHYE